MNNLKSIHFLHKNAVAGQSRPLSDFRILLYSHDSYGLGHLRRNLAIARALLERISNASILIVTGSPCATLFPLPERCDVIKLPAVGKDKDGHYEPRSLNISLDQVVALRRGLIMSAYESFDPDVILVDHKAAGLLDEVLPMIRRAHRDGKLNLFGVRDIIDTPAVIEGTWCCRVCRRALEQYYDHVCIYGDELVFDAMQEYPLLTKLSHKVSMLGYVGTPQKKREYKPSPGAQKHVLVTVGGGDDGEQRIQAYLEALQLAPVDWTTQIITGPLMDSQKIRYYKKYVKRSKLAGSVKIRHFHGDIPGLMRQADAVVGMAGYNSCVEILQSGTPAVLLPRDRMRQEQSIRAERLAALGLVQSVPVNDVTALRNALERALAKCPSQSAMPDMNGLDNLCSLIIRLSDLESSLTPARLGAGLGAE